jgi:glycerol-3-phosphate acyltransferase PlsX
VVLKVMESVGEYFLHAIRDMMGGAFPDGRPPETLAAAFREMGRKFDYAEYGGAPLLGIQGVCIISHGASNPKAIANAIRVASRAVSGGLNDAILQGIRRTGEGGA